MQKTFIGILFLILAVVLFALNNSKMVDIDFWIWNIESNLSLVLIVTVIFGAFMSFLLSLPYRSKKNNEINSRDKKIKSLESEIHRLKYKQPDPKPDVK